MKKSIKITLMLILLIAVMVIPTLISASTESKILKKSDKYLIYNESAMNEEFTFAFGTENQNKESLIFFPSAKDSNEEGAKNIAYIDETTKGYLNENSEAFLFVRNKEGKYIIEAEKIDLKNAIDNELIEETTQRIKVDTKQTEKTTKVIDGVKNEVTKGKVVITDEPKAKYSYVLVKLPTEGQKANEYTELMRLAEKISKKEELAELDLMQKLELMESFYTLYTAKAPEAKDSAWLPVENMEIMQPEDSKNGEQYIVFIKSENGTKTIIDAQFLTCYDEYSPLYEKETVTIKETSKLPVTFDSLTTIIIVLAIIIVAIIVVLLIRKKASKNEENK